ncbi:MAG: hypothetical protein PHS54_07485 [Clostridia bacterium]|nr:hypothetical protein [Clostridia bacterium]
MEIKFNIALTDKWLYSLITICVFLILGVGVYAYQSNQRMGNPSIAGHSAGEMNIEFGGQIKTLQEFIDSAKIITETIKVENSECWDDSKEHSLEANCPSGYKLISCSHSEGDMKESGESFRTIVDLENNMCKIIVRKPGCADDIENERQRVIAICYK